MVILILQSFIAFLCIIIFVLLSTKLCIWYFRYKEWIKKQNDYLTQKNSHNTQMNKVGQVMPNFEAYSIRSGESITINRILTDYHQFVFVFVDSFCAFCNTHLEFFRNNIHHFPEVKYAVIMHNKQEKEATDYFILFNKQIDIFTIDYRQFESMDLQFLPAFVLIDKNKIIINMTPSPTVLFGNLIPA